MPDAATPLLARGPLDGRVLPEGARLTIALAPAAARFVLRGDRTAADKVWSAFGAAPPAEPMRAAQSGKRAAIWLGPDEWLLLAPGEDPAWLRPFLQDALGIVPHSLVDVSHRQIGFGAGRALIAAERAKHVHRLDEIAKAEQEE